MTSLNLCNMQIAILRVTNWPTKPWMQSENNKQGRAMDALSSYPAGLPRQNSFLNSVSYCPDQIMRQLQTPGKGTLSGFIFLIFFVNTVNDVCLNAHKRISLDGNYFMVILSDKNWNLNVCKTR